MADWWQTCLIIYSVSWGKNCLYKTALSLRPWCLYTIVWQTELHLIWRTLHLSLFHPWLQMSPLCCARWLRFHGSVLAQFSTEVLQRLAHPSGVSCLSLSSFLFHKHLDHSWFHFIRSGMPLTSSSEVAPYKFAIKITVSRSMICHNSGQWILCSFYKLDCNATKKRVIIMESTGNQHVWQRYPWRHWDVRPISAYVTNMHIIMKTYKSINTVRSYKQNHPITD